MANNYFKDAQGNVWDATTKKIVVKADGTAKKPHTGHPEPPEEKKIENGYKQPKTTAKKATENKENIQKAHTILARETQLLNRTNPIDPSDPVQVQERGDWLFERCIELGITPTIPALVNAWGLKKADESRALNGEFGNSYVKEVMNNFFRALQQIAEGSLVDSVSGQTGRIAEMNNRYGWSQNPVGTIAQKQSLGELVSPEELKKAIEQMPQTDLTDKPIDVEFEVIEEKNNG